MMMENLPKEVKVEVPEAPPTPESPRPSGRKTHPGLVATGGAMFAAGLGFGVPGAIVGGLLGYWMGVKAAEGSESRDND